MQDRSYRGIWSRNYLLSIREFLEEENGQKLLKEALGKVDSKRRSKAECIGTDRGKAACLGAGLILQMAVQETTEQVCHRLPVLCRYEVSELLEKISAPVPITYRYGNAGKPYFRDNPFYFNLSHSGDYVFCVLSCAEVGADIQKHQNYNNEHLARRFFSPQEIVALQNCREGQDALFYRLWTRKEAYGKLTGEGIASVVGINCLPGAEQMAKGRKTVPNREVVWEEYSGMEGYYLAVCRYAENSAK